MSKKSDKHKGIIIFIFILLWIPFAFWLNSIKEKGEKTPKDNDRCVEWKTIIHATAVGPGKTVCVKLESELYFETF